MAAKEHVTSSDGSVTIFLIYPVQFPKNLMEEITLRRPKVKDRLSVDNLKITDADKEVRLLGNLAGLTPSELSELDMLDYGRVQEVLQGFLSPPLDESEI